jgi:oligopeptide/dipeptide ABC transporter ATP-binding protein
MSAKQDKQPQSPLVEIRDLSVRYKTRGNWVSAVDNVSFDIQRGEIIGLVGESGSGKSTLGKALMNMLPKGTQLDGHIYMDGEDVLAMDDERLRDMRGRQVSMIFQDPMTSLNPVQRIDDHLVEAISVHERKSKREGMLERIRTLAERLGIQRERVEDYPHQLSGGMRQRVVIATALACGPRLLIADEPTTALDVTVQDQILDLLQAQQRERFMAMMLVTHDLGVVAGRTDEIAVMYAGQIVERAPTRTLFANMKMPYTEALLQSIPKLDQPSHTRLQAISGRPPDLVSPPVGCRFAARCLYAQDRCLDEQPPLMEADTPGHLYRCWYPVGTPAGEEALNINLRKNRTAAGLKAATAAEGVGAVPS